MKRKTFIALALLSSTSLAISQVPDKARPSSTPTLSRITQTDNAAILNINNFTTWQRANGLGHYGPPSVSGDGGIFPRGTRWVLFADGLVWGAKAYLDSGLTQPSSQLIRIGGNTYNSGNQVGWIEGSGGTAQAVSSDNPRARIYRIRRDYAAMSATELTRDAAENLVTTIDQIGDAERQAVLAQYATDWNDWPVDLGAPYIERNGVPGYQPAPPFSEEFTYESLISGNYDEPGISNGDPFSPAGQVIWYVHNDLNVGTMNGFSGSPPMGLECQVTMWAYGQPGIYNNMYFKRLKILNKGGALRNPAPEPGWLYLDSVYVGAWVDPDVGDYLDDLVGCDSTEGLGFAYNSGPIDNEFIKFNLPPPAVGYDIVRGPSVPSPGDTAIRDFSVRLDERNLPATSFVYEIRCSLDDVIPFVWYQTRFWRQLQGYYPGCPSGSGPEGFYPHPPGVTVSRFPLSGDPVAQTGFLDGLGTAYSPAPGDRRFMISTGPFRLLPGDTQEVVLAVVAGLGADHVSSVSVMKSADKIAQAGIMGILRAPNRPQVTAVELDSEVILEWGSKGPAVKATENFVVAGEYEFEGYVVYQLSTGDPWVAEAKRVATFDRVNGITAVVGREFDYDLGAFVDVVKQYGTDNGIRRSIRITTDAFTGEALRNGTDYYFAVTSYNTGPGESGRVSLENELAPIHVRPRIPFGAAGMTRYGDTVYVSHISGSGAGTVLPTVVNPLAATGDIYEVRIDSGASGTTWSLWNVAAGRSVLSGYPLHTGQDDPPIVEGGLKLRVSGSFGSSDVYAYSISRIDSSDAVVKASLDRINVFPNPTHGASHATFTNLPRKVIIRIFNLSGQLVRVLEKDEPSQFLRWDLLNEKNRQVGSGMYVCLIEMPELGEERVVKLGVVQSQLYPNLR